MESNNALASEERLARRDFRLFAGTSTGSRLIVVSSVRRFRGLALELVRPDDSVLEIGCSTGETTLLLARQAKHVLATDSSEESVRRTSSLLAGFSHVMVERIDGREVPMLARLMPSPHVIFIDIGGKAPADSAVFILRSCLQFFSPRSVVVRNTELAAILSLTERVEIPLPEDWPFAPLGTTDQLRLQLLHLLSLSHSDRAASREYAARRLRHYRHPEAIDRLRQLAEDPQARVRRAAHNSLHHIATVLPDSPPSLAETMPRSGG